MVTKEKLLKLGCRIGMRAVAEFDEYHRQVRRANGRDDLSRDLRFT
ncbi:MAG: hypothetical protein BWY92_01631 [Firmicutes bacterium ADurb.BinA052]|nr:MAG: hypothetical protein BWY92_01631 [Firmicutes bacterium ADurb.BinA052]